ncbi:hypothetical protein FALBO_14475 [Fusarium albosuccineum]|uniref:Uncharacterized protein n=1 Tax=Fusarium albosuccineum TaxID=1237068 RepID=A0A8H4L047_9HYPO|nr:hypothetical protein FALBO_14475 [Fusarium albosuccineum]
MARKDTTSGGHLASRIGPDVDLIYVRCRLFAWGLFMMMQPGRQWTFDLLGARALPEPQVNLPPAATSLTNLSGRSSSRHPQRTFQRKPGRAPSTAPPTSTSILLLGPRTSRLTSPATASRIIISFSSLALAVIATFDPSPYSIILADSISLRQPSVIDPQYRAQPSRPRCRALARSRRCDRHLPANDVEIYWTGIAPLPSYPGPSFNARSGCLAILPSISCASRSLPSTASHPPIS